MNKNDDGLNSYNNIFRFHFSTTECRFVLLELRSANRSCLHHMSCPWSDVESVVDTVYRLTRGHASYDDIYVQTASTQ